MNPYKFLLLFFLLQYVSFCMAEDTVLPTDSSYIEFRQLDTNALEQYRQDEDYQYSISSSRELSWQEIIRQKIMDFLNKNDPDGNLMDIFYFILILVVVALVIFGVIRLKARGLFSRSAKEIDPEQLMARETLEGNDFEAMIKASQQAEDFPKAIRLLYLETLRMLTRRNLIQWQIDKTNMDYLEEMYQHKLFPQFLSLTRNYELACYGQFSVSKERYNEIENTFRQFQQELK